MDQLDPFYAKLVGLYDSMDTAIRAAEQNDLADVRRRLEDISVDARKLADAPEIQSCERRSARKKRTPRRTG
jgi:hypothetical protein